jgi:hypothetical protein
MTQDEIREIATGIGLKYRKDNNEIYTPDCDGIHIDELRLFSELVAQHERERIFGELLKMHEIASSRHNYYLNAVLTIGKRGQV